MRRRGYLQSAVLAAIGIPGILAVAAVAPNTLQVLGRLGVVPRLQDQSASALIRLRRKGLIQFVEIRGLRYARITKKGSRYLAYETERISLATRRRSRWDGRFRIVMFDIPERRRGTRIALRRHMRQFGFLRIQDSVWAYPYDCEDLLALLKADLRIGKDVIYAVVEQMEHDGWIRDHFGLRRG